MKTLLVATTVHAQSTNRWLTRPAGSGNLAALVKSPDDKHEIGVAFFCDINTNGTASNFLLYRPTDTNNAFVVAVRKALDAATFEPAIWIGKT